LIAYERIFDFIEGHLHHLDDDTGIQRVKVFDNGRNKVFGESRRERHPQLPSRQIPHILQRTLGCPSASTA
jgi:hypothetical protein